MPETRLPFSWEECRLGDVVDYGATQKAEPHEIPDDAWVLELEDIEKDTSQVLQRVTFAHRQSKSTKNRFAVGDVLYGKLRPYLNKVVRADQDGYCTTEIVPLKPSEAIDGGYLFYWLKHPTFLEYVTSVSHGLNMPRLGTEAGKAAPFVLAPLAEQKRIADKLGAILARVDACRERLDRIPAILKRFRQAVLAAATCGQLTEEWRASRDSSQDLRSSEELINSDLQTKTNLRETTNFNRGVLRVDPESKFRVCLPSSWSWSSWGTVSDWITYGFTRPMPHVVTGVPIVTAKNVSEGRIIFESADLTTEEAFRSLSDKDKPRQGDLLITKDGTIGRVAIVEQDDPDKFCINQSVAVVWLRTTGMNKRFLAIVAQAPFTQAFISEYARGMAVPHLSITDFARCPLPVPLLDEQLEIVRRVETMFAHADRLEARYTTARAKVEHLTPTLLAKAFRGELVPQDPNDEPASVLLERIRTSRIAAGEKSPRKERAERKPMATTLTTDALKEIIRSLPTDQFTFDDLRRQVSADYETLKDVVFDLLSEAPASLKQVFDTEAKMMRLVRVK